MPATVIFHNKNFLNEFALSPGGIALADAPGGILL